MTWAQLMTSSNLTTPSHQETPQTSDTEGVDQTIEGGVRRQIVTALAPPTPGRTSTSHLA